MQRDIVILGVLVSLIFWEWSNMSPAGLIVPVYLVLSLNSPLRVVHTLFIALITFIIVKLLSQKMIIYGRRRFSMMIIVSFILMYILNKWLKPDFSTIGILIPGIIANEFEKQGVFNSLVSLLIVMGIIMLILYLFDYSFFL